MSDLYLFKSVNLKSQISNTHSLVIINNYAMTDFALLKEARDRRKQVILVVAGGFIGPQWPL